MESSNALLGAVNGIRALDAMDASLFGFSVDSSAEDDPAGSSLYSLVVIAADCWMILLVGMELQLELQVNEKAETQDLPIDLVSRLAIMTLFSLITICISMERGKRRMQLIDCSSSRYVSL